MQQIKSIITVCVFILCFSTLISCSKDNTLSSINSSQQFLVNKTWYLDYTQTISSTGSITKTFIGQPTYYINFLTDKGTEDSDGIKGTYSIEQSNSQLQLHVIAHTINGNPIEYIYKIESIGAKNLVLNHSLNNTTIKQFYSAK